MTSWAGNYELNSTDMYWQNICALNKELTLMLQIHVLSYIVRFSIYLRQIKEKCKWEKSTLVFGNVSPGIYQI